MYNVMHKQKPGIISFRVDGGMVDAIHSKCIDVNHEGSIPSLPTKISHW
jgi:hypothetical protein